MANLQVILVKNNLAIKAIGIVEDDQSNWYCKHTQVILVNNMPIKAMIERARKEFASLFWILPISTAAGGQLLKR